MRIHIKQRFRSVAALVAVALLLPLFAAAEQLPAANKALLIFRILAFDRALADRAGETIVVAVVSREGVQESEADQAEMVAAMTELAKTTSIVGRTIRVVRVPFQGGDRLDASLSQERAVAAYLTPSLTEQLGVISQVARKRDILTFSGVEAYIEAGVSFGVVRRGAKPSILVNLPATKAEGALVDTALLRIAEVVKR